MECTVANKKLVTLSSAVRASIIDKYEDIGKTQQRYTHWACREYKLLYTQVLPKIPHKALLEVNPNTHTATLPLDFAGETFVGGINEHWQKVPIKLNNSIVDSKNIINIPCEDACQKCQQDTGICNDLTVTEDTEIIVIEDQPYNKTTIKKLYPNGDYYLEVTTPVLDVDTETVTYATKKTFITNFDLKPCGCLDTTPANIVTLQTHCPDVYCNYYASCASCTSPQSGYRIFEESGLIQFDANFPYSRVYIEYNGYLSKIGGQYYIPEVAFECIVEGIKKRAIKDKPNIPNWQIYNQKEDYRIAKRDLQKVLGRISLLQIIQAINLIPKFDIDNGYNHYACFNSSSITVPNTTSNLAALSSIDGGAGGGGNNGSCSTVNNNYITINNRLSYTLAVQANGNPGEPVAGQPLYQNDLLIGASGVEYIFLNEQVLSRILGKFTIDYAMGIVDISPNAFVAGDALIINYNKN